MKELFRIGNFGVYLFGVSIAIGMLTGMFVMSREAARKSLDKDKMLDLAMYTIVALIIGARLYYILAFNFSYYMENPVEIFKISSGGLSVQGGLMGGTIFAWWYTRKRGIPFLKAADAFAPAIAIGQAIGRIGCDVYGIPMKTIYPWGVTVGKQILHPAQMYEMFLDLILFIYLWRNRGRAKYDGMLFIKYVIGFSVNRAIVEFFRSNPIVAGPFTIAHVTSFIIIILAVIAGRIIKNRSEIIQGNGTSDRVRVPVYQYILIVLLGAGGTVIYYLTN